jgi:3-oxosteroid 1-dehydrogenase
VDEDFHRGESAYDRYYDDPANKPNPNLGEISHAPYYAAKMVPGDLGTKGGIRTDVHARALRDDGTVINGLYAAGNVSAPVMGPHLPRPGRHHRPGHGVRLSRGTAYRRQGVTCP